jgi:hypothetical protein
LRSSGAAPEHGALGDLVYLLGDGKAVKSEGEELRAGKAAMLANEAPSAEPEPSFLRGALIGLMLSSGDGHTSGGICFRPLARVYNGPRVEVLSDVAETW